MKHEAKFSRLRNGLVGCDSFVLEADTAEERLWLNLLYNRVFHIAITGKFPKTPKQRAEFLALDHLGIDTKDSKGATTDKS